LKLFWELGWEDEREQQRGLNLNDILDTL
jgi:hypothetical protein